MEAGLSRALPYLGLAGVWALYFAAHSLLATPALKARAARHGARWRRGYRLAYNLLALVLILPPVWLTFRLDGPAIITWSGWAWWLAQSAALLAVLGFLSTLPRYDMRHFLGLRQWRGEAITDGGVEPWEPLRVSGAHRYVRHPWYFLGLVVLWTRDLDLAALVTAGAITGYLIVGSRLEERKLLAAYGEAYADYRRRVPGLVPLPGRALSREEAEELARRANTGGGAP